MASSTSGEYTKGGAGVVHRVDGRVKWAALRQSGTGLQMEISDRLRCLYSASVEERDGEYVVDVPAQEIQLGDIEVGETYRIALLPAPPTSETETNTSHASASEDRSPPGPPVDEGDHRDVEIEDIGEQGDGITRVERGFVVIVPDATQGERVTVEITDVRENVAFAEVVSRETHFE